MLILRHVAGILKDQPGNVLWKYFGLIQILNWKYSIIISSISWDLTEIKFAKSLDLGKVLWNGRYFTRSIIKWIRVHWITVGNCDKGCMSPNISYWQASDRSYISYKVFYNQPFLFQYDLAIPGPYFNQRNFHVI